ncbi:MAG: hypothetical protein HKN98_16410 [Silicimonas sp.]|nr:hypothetical protein [Silicimonas sp.]NND21448.1 hypothetical protein [Silicimonas sp.]RZW03556.1 MAG: hypothetical protein EX266_11315 [Paracoccaceae bacterium]
MSAKELLGWSVGRIGRHLIVALCLACAGVPAFAGPPEVPPPEYQPMQFVDDEGCLFVRADVSGWTVWVQHLDAARQPVCDRVPTSLNLPDRAPEASAVDAV